jgi:hypothetical protein
MVIQWQEILEIGRPFLSLKTRISLSGNIIQKEFSLLLHFMFLLTSDGLSLSIYLLFGLKKFLLGYKSFSGFSLKITLWLEIILWLGVWLNPWNVRCVKSLNMLDILCSNA